MSFFYTTMARRCANILIAKCQDQGVDVVLVHPDGCVTTEIQGDYYTLGWDVSDQTPVLVATQAAQIVHVA